MIKPRFQPRFFYTPRIDIEGYVAYSLSNGERPDSKQWSIETLAKHKWTAGLVGRCECGSTREAIAFVGVYELRTVTTPDGIKHTGYTPACTRKPKGRKS